MSAAPALTFGTTAGLLLIQVQPDQTATFEELMETLKTALARTPNAALRARGAGLKGYKSSQTMGGYALYVVVVDPTTPQAEYYPVELLAKTLTAKNSSPPRCRSASGRTPRRLRR